MANDGGSGGGKGPVHEPEVLPADDERADAEAAAATVQAWKEVLTSEVFRDLVKGVVAGITGTIESVAARGVKKEELQLAAKKEADERWYSANLKALLIRGTLQFSALAAVYLLASEGIFKAEVAAPLFVAIVASLFVPPNRPSQGGG